MKKLKLQELEVATFAPAAAPHLRATVRAHEFLDDAADYLTQFCDPTWEPNCCEERVDG
jgi:hypothetical protein